MSGRLTIASAGYGEVKKNEKMNISTSELPLGRPFVTYPKSMQDTECIGLATG